MASQGAIVGAYPAEYCSSELHVIRAVVLSLFNAKTLCDDPNIKLLLLLLHNYNLLRP